MGENYALYYVTERAVCIFYLTGWRQTALIIMMPGRLLVAAVIDFNTEQS